MENENKKSVAGTVWKIIGIVVAVAGVCFIGYKIYDKFFRKKKTAAVAAEDALDETLELDGEEIFEANADEVIANAEVIDAE